jgi:hypothetical protein
MADPVNDIVSIEITRNSTYPTATGFGLPLLHSYHTVFPERYRLYSDLSEMLSDGFTSSHAAYRMAAAVFAQNPNVPQVMIGRKVTAPAFTTVVKVTSAVEGAHVRFKLVEPVTGTVQQVDYEIPASATTTTVATAVELLVEAFTGVDSTAATDSVTITPTAAGRKVHVYDLENATVAETTADAGYDDDLAELQLLNDDFYGVAIDSNSSANILAVADWAMASESPKLFVAQVANTAQTTDPLDSSTDVADQLIADSNERTALFFTFDSDDHIDAAVLGMGLTSNPGAITWANQTLLGVTARSLSTSQRNALAASNVNYYVPVRGLNITQLGVVASGEYIDVIHGLDALEADIQTSVLSVIAGRDKVPVTPPGMAILEGAVMGALKRFEPADANGTGSLLVFKSSAVKMPDPALISQADKAARTVRGVKFSATLSGAVHHVRIAGQINI